MNWSPNAEVPLRWLPILPTKKFCRQVGSPDGTSKLRFPHRLLYDEDKRVSRILQRCEFPVQRRAPFPNHLYHQTTRLANCSLDPGALMKRLTTI